MVLVRCSVPDCDFMSQGVQAHRALRNHALKKHGLQYKANRPLVKPAGGNSDFSRELSAKEFEETACNQYVPSDGCMQSECEKIFQTLIWDRNLNTDSRCELLLRFAQIHVDNVKKCMLERMSKEWNDNVSECKNESMDTESENETRSIEKPAQIHADNRKKCMLKRKSRKSKKTMDTENESENESESSEKLAQIHADNVKKCLPKRNLRKKASTIHKWESLIE